MDSKTQIELIEHMPEEMTVADKWARVNSDLRDQFPIRAGIMLSMKYDSARDRYVAKFELAHKPIEYKMQVGVARFILERISLERSPTDFWFHMNDQGEIDDCFLVTL